MAKKQKTTKQQKIFIAILVLIVIAAVSVIGYPWVRQGKMNQMQNEQLQDRPQQETGSSCVGDAINQEVGVEKTDTSAWKTYRNRIYGYELKYPYSCSISTRDPLTADPEKAESPSFGLGWHSNMKIEFTQSPQGCSFEQWVMDSIKNGEIRTCERTWIDGHRAYRIVLKGNFNLITIPRAHNITTGGSFYEEFMEITLVKAKSNFIIITYPYKGADYEVLKAMLSTVSF